MQTKNIPVPSAAEEPPVRPRPDSDRLADAHERFRRHLLRAGLKRTAQRDLIVEVFLHTEDHLSSEDLYRLVKERDNTIGQTTIYRTLKLLVEAGLAGEVRLGDGRTRYEPHDKFPHHDHMVCVACRRTIEFYSPELKELQNQIAAAHGFAVTEHSLRIFGKCEDCAAKQPDADAAEA